MTAHQLLAAAGTGLSAAALGYLVVALTAVWRRGRARPAPPLADPVPVTILKPLCGAEPRLADCLRSFCAQRYPQVQIIFGVRTADDPAVAIVQQLQREYPGRALELVIDPRQHGTSAKVSNLMNMMSRARHDWLVLADADVEVRPDYLSRVVPPLADPRVGVVTCPYRGRAQRGVWSQLGAAFINDWFMPSVCVAALFGSRAFAFGATIALRRDALEGIGGFAAIVDQLADDYRLGELTRRNGLATVLADTWVDTWIHERTLGQLVRHELRWLRTIRAVQPAGYTFSFVTFALPLAVLGTVLAGGAHGTALILAGAAGVRLMLHFGVRTARSAFAQLWVLPLNDMLAFALWCWGFVSRHVHWREARFRVARDGSVEPVR